MKKSFWVLLFERFWKQLLRFITNKMVSFLPSRCIVLKIFRKQNCTQKSSSSAMRSLIFAVIFTGIKALPLVQIYLAINAVAIQHLRALLKMIRETVIPRCYQLYQVYIKVDAFVILRIFVLNKNENRTTSMSKTRAGLHEKTLKRKARAKNGCILWKTIKVEIVLQISPEHGRRISIYG